MGVPLTVGYLSDCSVKGYQDREFGTRIAWDADLLAGYDFKILCPGEPIANLRQHLAIYRSLKAFWRSARPSAVLVQGYTNSFDRVAILIAFQEKTPIIFRAEATDHALQRSRWKCLARDSILKRFYARCAAILYIGVRAKAHYQRLGVPSSRQIFSPYCVDASRFFPSETDREQLRRPCREALGVADDAVLLLYSGKLVSRKGVEEIVPAVRMLPAHLRQRVVVGFLGDGELRGNIEQEATARPQVPIRIIGFQNQSQLSQYYHAADALILPSRQSETWGLVINEALHHGVPVVISSAVGCGPDLVKSEVSGASFRAGDMTDMSRAITHVLTMDNAVDSRQTRRRIVADYSPRAAADGIRKAFLDIGY